MAGEFVCVLDACINIYADDFFPPRTLCHGVHCAVVHKGMGRLS